eukprot:gnl/TRDRNA2_/TRDRNA2_183815_c0_seq1.p1 gnl/TRDRNA2_/TRDRNA2_183815_c0~~gnl/TRDRNA2_/TRDRNA2_183815_c0_seq1.p1  ORF type:complete len:372 (-),score=44.65 gnl/TRDRNA2_/TRDRNA2_183815_c0_seq1:92-1207(-)
MSTTFAGGTPPTGGASPVQIRSMPDTPNGAGSPAPGNRGRSSSPTPNRSGAFSLPRQGRMNPPPPNYQGYEQGPPNDPPDDVKFQPALDASSSARSITAMFTMACFCIYGAPTILSLQLGSDGDGAYWIGGIGQLAMMLPFFFIAHHIAQMWLHDRGQHGRVLLVWVMALPGMFYMICGGIYMNRGEYLYGQLKSDECHGRGDIAYEKERLQEAYMEAYNILQNCTARLLEANGGAQLAYSPTLQGCDEWSEVGGAGDGAFGWVTPWKPYHISGKRTRGLHVDYRREWQYLAQLEANHVCGGFCEPGPMLWVNFAETGRPLPNMCKPFVAQKMMLLSSEGTIVFWVGFVIAALSFPAYFMIKPTLERLDLY